MKLVGSLVIALIVFPIIASTSKANSVSLSTDSIEYEGYNLSGQSISFSTNLNSNYGYELSFQRFNSYSLNDRQDHLTINNKIDLTNISLGLYREVRFSKFYFRPIIGVVHSTVNVHTVLRYRDEFKLFSDDYPIDLSYEQYSSKTALIPMYGVNIGYYLTEKFGIFIGYREQGYPVKMLGFKKEF